MNRRGGRRLLSIAVSIAIAAPGARAAEINLASTPLFVSTPVTPNVLVIFDNSQSMDGYMGGQVVSGDNPSTRSNIGREVMRNIITSYRSAFNWGLMTYEMSFGPGKYPIYGYYLGNDTTMKFTDDCQPQGGVAISDLTPGVSAANANRRCVPNPQPFSGGNYVTFDKSGDDPDVNDVLYVGVNQPSLWGLTAGGTNYSIYVTHNTGGGWSAGDFSGSYGVWGFTPTDAGFLSSAPQTTRQLYLPRGWGYYGGITGQGFLNRAVQADSGTHYASLMSLLATQTGDATGEIKDGAVFTPLTGTLESAKDYFRAAYRGNPSPIQYSCQKNFVTLVTDGLPTGTTGGELYSDAARTITPNGSGGYTLGAAYTNAIDAVAALRSVSHASETYDIKTYVVGLGDTVNNPGAIHVMDRMAQEGGTGLSYRATNASAFASALDTIARDIVSQTGAAASVALNTGSISADSKVFQAKFHSGDWSGQLNAYPVGADGALGASLWEAGAVLATQNHDTGRSILTFKPSSRKGVPFRWPADPAQPGTAELDVAQTTALGKNVAGIADGNGAARLAYVRGATTNEAPAGLGFRARASRLGDIVNSAPYYVGAPSFAYSDALESARYSSFVSTYRSRTPMIYIGANDGMLHGFEAATGRELLAYIPSKMIPKLTSLTSSGYNHQYFVDGSPTVGDVFYDGAWHTVLVGGLNAGGQGYYAIDVTNPGGFSEATAHTTVLWEFNDTDDTSGDSDSRHGLGFSFGQPAIVRMANGKWAAVFGNGYNNTNADGAASTSGSAILYIIDIQTGALIRKISTKSGSASTPNGLGTVTPVDTDSDGDVDVIYAGDLRGNVWKFDVSSTNPANWAVAFTQSSGEGGTSPRAFFKTPRRPGREDDADRQPITSRIEVGRHPVSGLMIWFGTGKYLEMSDIPNRDDQTFYGLWDSGSALGDSPRLLEQSVTDVVTAAGGQFRVLTNNALPRASWGTGTGQYQGWKIDLPTSGERSVTTPILHGGRIVFNTLVPSDEPCSYGGYGWLMEVDAYSGGRLTVSPFDTNGDRTVNAADVLSSNRIAGGQRIGAISATPVILGAQTRVKVEDKYLNLSSGVVQQVKESANTRPSGRVSWEEIVQ